MESQSYLIEIEKFFPDVHVYQQACPLWVPLVENNEYNSPGADYFIKKDVDHLLKNSPEIDAILLACTHYPLLSNKIKKYVPAGVKLISQGEIIASGLENYLLRHPEIDEKCGKNGHMQFFTTDSVADFDKHSSVFFGERVNSIHVDL